MPAKRILLIGAGHAHLEAVSRIGDWTRQGIRVDVVAPSEFHYYSGMGPGMLGGTYTPEELRFPVKKMIEARGGFFHEDRAVHIDADRRRVRLDSGHVLEYDVLSCNTGSGVPDGIIENSADVYTVKPIVNLLAARERITGGIRQRPLRFAVIGGGPAALEIAGNLRRFCRLLGAEAAEINLYAGGPLLTVWPGRVARIARRNFARRNIAIDESGRVNAVRFHELEIENGARHPFDILFLAIGVRPSKLFADSGLPTGPDGGLAVNQYLQSPAHPEIFGGGDAVYFQEAPLDKVGVHAVYQNPVLAENLPAFLEGKPLTPFHPKKTYLLILNLGDGTGIFRRGRIVFDGRLAYRIKDRIDRRFIARFTP